MTKHDIDLMKAAMPHLGSQPKQSIEVAIKMGELLESVSTLGNKSELSACDLNSEPPDMEALLVSIQEVCSNQEKELVHNILNFIKARKLYQTYQTFSASNSGKSDHAKDGIPFHSGSGDIMEFFKTQLNSEQKNTFENLSTLMGAMNL